MLPTTLALALAFSPHAPLPTRRSLLTAAGVAIVGSPPAANAATGTAVDLVIRVGESSTRARALQFYVREEAPIHRANYAPLQRRMARERANLQQLLGDMAAAAPDLRICAPDLAACDCAPDPMRMASASGQVDVVRAQLMALDTALADARGFDLLEAGQATYLGGGVELALEEICEASDTFLDLASGRPLMTDRVGPLLDSNRIGSLIDPTAAASRTAPLAFAGRAAAMNQRVAIPRLSAASTGAFPTLTRWRHRVEALAMHATPPECIDKLDRGLLRACALGWAAIAAALIYDPSSVAYDVFGLDVSGGYGVQQPAAGFLQLAGTLMPLEAVLLLALASGSLGALETRARVSASIALAGAGVAATCAAAAATGLSLEEPAAVAAVLSLGGASAVAVARPLLREVARSELAVLYANDVRTLLGGGGGGDGDGDGDGGALAAFYRSSALASVLVGAAFMLSPVSPLAVYEAELPVTYLARADFGVYLALLLAPVQFALYRAAAERRLGETTPRFLNLACACAIALLDGCGNAQVRAQEVLVAGVDGLPDTFRFDTNTTAAFYTALLVALVYLAQGLRTEAKEATRP